MDHNHWRRTSSAGHLALSLNPEEPGLQRRCGDERNDKAKTGAEEDCGRVLRVPKLSNSGHKLRYDFSEDWATYYKFVIVEPNRDLREVKNFVEEHRIDPEKVIVQPDGNRQDYIQALKELSDAVMELGLPFRVLPNFTELFPIDRIASLN